MLLQQATVGNVSRALREINAFEWEGDFKPMVRKALKELLEKGMEEEMAEFVGFRQHACNLRVKGDGLTLVLKV